MKFFFCSVYADANTIGGSRKKKKDCWSKLMICCSFTKYWTRTPSRSPTVDSWRMRIYMDSNQSFV